MVPKRRDSIAAFRSVGAMSSASSMSASPLSTVTYTLRPGARDLRKARVERASRPAP
jgi:hypothetical protein